MADHAGPPSILPRFEGSDGKKRLAGALTRQTLVGGDAAIAAALAQKAGLLETQASQIVAEQGGADNSIYFIISGSVDVVIDGRVVATRVAGTHVGEMAVIDPTARRSATIRSSEPCVFAHISESDFSSLAQANPRLWRAVAVELGNRLRERARYIRPPHNQPVVFVGSSSEQLEIAREIQLGLSHDPMVINVWTDGVFKASRTAIESLLAAVSESDFAVLVVSPDDLIQSRGLDAYGPRDNVLFELGLFMGGISRDRTFMVRPRSVDLKVPSDLLGFTPLDYAIGESDTVTARIAPVCTELRRAILAAGPR